ncbi:WXG100 family type VII secretion target [Bacillus paramobilis]|uniref:WXG100 family type VII secretion target n=1 Tax=Bacillus paramobilis TaxID=2817477 RepID=UPI000BED36BD|nr:type VII secretion protein [Bacillus cereus]PER21264.1 type VII secretion protein [Bacillus cereus]
MTEIKIKPEELRNKANSFRNAISESNERHNRILGELLNLQMKWIGASSLSFYNELPRLNKSHESHIQSLTNIENELKRIADKFEVADENYDVMAPFFNKFMNTTSGSSDHLKIKESGAVFGNPDKNSSAITDVLKYETDIQLPKNVNAFFSDVASMDKIGGEAKGALVDAGFKVGDFTVHEQLVRGEVKAQFGGGIGGEAKAGVTFNDIGVDHEYGKIHAKLGNAEAGVEVKDGHIGFGAKADLAKGEAEAKIPIPFTDWKVVVGGEAAYGSIGAEAKFGLMNELDVGLGIGLGVKFGVEKG